ncbi:UDP-N-acetylglucosamine 2-epimerase (non-hydrolyzing) [Myxococcota bacterium]|nr:UDP-N-acetylglucosamine 2-epimerase (non-hydrolyzing) [Myxococcota bacterium]
MRILLVFGTRPEAIKMAPVVLALRDRPDRFETRICVTAQHRGMLDEVLSLFRIVPDRDLDIMRPGQDLFEVTTRAMLGLRDVLGDLAPDLVLVHGDTSTSLAAALSAFYLRIPVGHVEAGLRTWDVSSPFPEEANRQITGRLARWHFVPTEGNRANLLREGVPEDRVLVTGNTVIDALHRVVHRLRTDPPLREAVARDLTAAGYAPSGRRCVLVTAHRRENFGDGMLGICRSLRALAEVHPEVDLVYPVHPNPNVEGPVRRELAGIPNVFLLPPVRYDAMAFLMDAAHLILSDSGGLQEEGPALGKPVLVLRRNTERPEAVEAGTVRLVGTEPDVVVPAARSLLTDPEAHARMARASNPYGDGRAADRIAEFLMERRET